MIEIVTKQGVALDLTSNIDIEFTIEQPLMDAENMPIGISTTIAFPLTHTNRRVFGYWDGAFVGVLNSTIPAQLLVDGVVLLDGELSFIGVNEDEIEYSFRGAEISSLAEGNIHELSDLTIVSKWNTNLLAESRSAGRSDVAFPMMIRKTYVAECEHQVGTGTYYPSAPNYAASNEACSPGEKYVNHGLSYSPNGNIAVVRVLWLIQKVFPSVIIEEDVLELLDKLVIIAPNDVTSTKNLGIYESSYDEGDRNVLDLAKALPETPFADFLSSVLKMFAASIYATGQNYQIKTSRSVFDDTHYVDWSKKVCELTSVSMREAQAYELSYANSPDSTEEDSRAEGVEIPTYSTLEELLAYFNTQAELTNAFVSGCPDLFAGKKLDVSLLYETVFDGANIGFKWTTPLVSLPIIDNANHLSCKSVVVDSTNAETFNYKIDFNCVKCVPVLTYFEGEQSEGYGSGLKAVCPVLDFPNPEGDRTSDIYIGLLLNNQLVAYGNTYSGQSWGQGTAASSAGVEEENNLSIALSGDNGLYAKFHEKLAAWITAKKHIFKMNVRLDISDIANLDLSQKVMVHNQLFLIKSVTIKVNTLYGVGVSEVELIEV